MWKLSLEVLVKICVILFTASISTKYCQYIFIKCRYRHLLYFQIVFLTTLMMMMMMMMMSVVIVS